MKTLAEMSDKEFDKYLSGIKPHLPIWKQDTAVVHSEMENMFVDRMNNTAIIKKIYWVDKKGKKHSSVAWVRWITE